MLHYIVVWGRVPGIHSGPIKVLFYITNISNTNVQVFSTLHLIEQFWTTCLHRNCVVCLWTHLQLHLSSHLTIFLCSTWQIPRAQSMVLAKNCCMTGCFVIFLPIDITSMSSKWPILDCGIQMHFQHLQRQVCNFLMPHHCTLLTNY